MFYIKQLWANEWAVMKHYEDSNEEQWRTFDNYDDALEFCHYMNGGTPTQYMEANYQVYEWRLVHISKVV